MELRTDCVPYAPESEGPSDVGECVIDNASGETPTEVRPSAPLPPERTSHPRNSFRLAAAALSLAVLALLSVGVVAHSLALKIETATSVADHAMEIAAEIETDMFELQMSNSDIVLSTRPEDVLNNKNRRYAEIDPTGKGFSSLDSVAGRFLISCEGVQPYLDGHKVILEIGNPSNMTVAGFKMKIWFGRRFADQSQGGRAALDAFDRWAQTHLKGAEKSFADRLLPGTWTKVEFILCPTKPEEMGYMVVSDFETNTVSLLKGG